MRLDNPSISGSISYLGGGTNTISGIDAKITGSFTGSFTGEVLGTSSIATTASYIKLSNVDGSASLASRITINSASIASLETVSGSYANSASFASNISANSASIASLETVSGSYANSASFASNISANSASIASLETVSGSYANSASFASNISLNSSSIGSLNAVSSSYLLNTTDTLTGDLTVTGNIIATTLNVQDVTASVIYSSGSNIFGSSSIDTQQFTGSILTSGSIEVNGNKFTVSGATGNTVVGGTLNSGAITSTGAGTFGGNISVASGTISVLGGNNMTLAGPASHGGISFATNSILPATAAATNNNVFDLGATAERFKNLYLGSEIISGGGATFAGSITGLTSSFVSTVAGTTVVSAEGAYAGSGSVKLFEAKRSGGAVAADWSYDDATTDMSLGTSTAHSFSLKTGNTRALTISNSGNATFAGELVSINAGRYFKIQNAAGNANFPTYSFQNDGNTGILSASSDSLGFITGGTTALTLDSAQDATFAGNLIIHNTSNAPFIDFVESGATSDSKARITMDQIDTNNGTLLFATENAGTLFNQVKITQTGDLALSNDAASFNTSVAKLNLVPASNGVYQQWNYSPDNENFALKLKETVTSGNVRYVFEQNNNGTTYSNALVFNEGKIGIGTSSPADKLTVNGNIIIQGADTNTGYDRYLKLYGNSDPTTNPNRWAGLAVYNNGGNNVNELAFFTGSGDSARTEKIRITNSGDLLINNNQEFQSKDAAGTAARILYLDNADTLILGNPTTVDDIRFDVDTYGEGVMIIKSSGNVGIGTATPTNGKVQIHTASAISFSPSVFTSGANLRLQTGGSAGTGVTTGVSMGVGGAAEAYIGAVQNASTYADIVFQTYNGAYDERMRIDSDGNVSIKQGKLSIGQSSENNIAYTTGETWIGSNGLRYNSGSDTFARSSATAQAAMMVLTDTADVKFYTQASTSATGTYALTPKMVIEGATGDVGIGSADPRNRLTVKTAGSASSEVALRLVNPVGFTNAGAGARMVFAQDRSDSESYEMAAIDGIQGAAGSSSNGELGFFTRESSVLAERLRITAAGITKAFRGNAGDLFFADNSSSAGGGIINYNSSLAQQSNNTSCSHFKGTTQNIASYHLYGNGSSSWSSDSRLKRDIETTRDGYIDDINKLRVVKYKWKNDENSGQQLGLIAQEVEKIFPSLVVDHEDAVGNGETYKSLKYSVLPTILLKGMQEQQKMIQELKAEIEILKNK